MVLCNEMSYYTKFGRRKARGGFRLNKHRPSRRIYVLGLRSNLLYMIKQFLNGFKYSYGQIMESVKNLVTRSSKRKRSRRKCFIIKDSRSSSSSSSSSSEMVRSFGRTNSFYTEAIADCIEFIKRSSVSVDDNESSAAATDDSGSAGRIEKNIDCLCAMAMHK